VALNAVSAGGLLTYLGAFLAEQLGLGTGQVGIAYMVAGGGFFLGSLAAGGRLGHVRPRRLAGWSYVAAGLAVCPTFAAPVGSVAVVALLAGQAFAAGVAAVALATLLLGETPGGAATTMVLKGSLFNLGTAGGGVLGGLLLAAGGYAALGFGLPLFSVAAALLVLRPGDPPARPAQQERRAAAVATLRRSESDVVPLFPTLPDAVGAAGPSGWPAEGGERPALPPEAAVGLLGH
jgi:predicted MFS family arabinose efflux permease